MDKEAGKPLTGLTDEERLALKPAFEKIDAGYRELDSTLAAMGRPPIDDDAPGGMCGTGCGCSSFLAGGANPRICARPFCRHSFKAHLT